MNVMKKLLGKVGEPLRRKRKAKDGPKLADGKKQRKRNYKTRIRGGASLLNAGF